MLSFNSRLTKTYHTGRYCSDNNVLSVIDSRVLLSTSVIITAQYVINNQWALLELSWSPVGITRDQLELLEHIGRY